MDPVIAVNQPAPDFTLPNLSGKPHTLSAFQSRVVILNFWSAECPWAVRADENLLPLLEAWQDRVILFSIAANANETAHQLAEAAIVRRVRIVLHDTDRIVADLYGAVTTPHFFVVDSEGILRYQGAFDDVTFRQRVPDQAFLRQAVDAVLAGRQPNPDQTPPYGCTLVRFSS
jgi:peroxiredoxin